MQNRDFNALFFQYQLFFVYMFLLLAFRLRLLVLLPSHGAAADLSPSHSCLGIPRAWQLSVVARLGVIRSSSKCLWVNFFDKHIMLLLPWSLIKQYCLFSAKTIKNIFLKWTRHILLKLRNLVCLEAKAFENGQEIQVLFQTVWVPDGNLYASLFSFVKW